MVSLDQILASNARISKDLPPGLVGVFVGATKGIGLTTVKAFVRHTVNPKVYIVGRSVSAGEQLVQDCQKLNPQGEYIFISKDVSLLKGVDEVCEEIQSRESVVNLLFCSQGTVKGRTGTHSYTPSTILTPCALATNIHSLTTTKYRPTYNRQD